MEFVAYPADVALCVPPHQAGVQSFPGGAVDDGTVQAASACHAALIPAVTAIGGFRFLEYFRYAVRPFDGGVQGFAAQAETYPYAALVRGDLRQPRFAGSRNVVEHRDIPAEAEHDYFSVLAVEKDVTAVGYRTRVIEGVESVRERVEHVFLVVPNIYDDDLIDPIAGFGVVYAGISAHIPGIGRDDRPHGKFSGRTVGRLQGVVADLYDCYGLFGLACRYRHFARAFGCRHVVVYGQQEGVVRFFHNPYPCRRRLGVPRCGTGRDLYPERFRIHAAERTGGHAHFDVLYFVLSGLGASDESSEQWQQQGCRCKNMLFHEVQG